MTRQVLAAVALSLLIGTACEPRREPGDAPRDSAATTPRRPTAGLLGSCCPDTDSGVIALMPRYENTPERERLVELAVFPYRIWSGLTDRERLVVRDSAAWARLWPRIVGSHRPAARVPAVDFSEEMLLVASMGTRATGGFTTMIDSVAVTNDTVRVVVRETSPGPRCGTAGALSTPMALARIQRSELPVAFVTREVVHDCP